MCHKRSGVFIFPTLAFYFFFSSAGSLARYGHLFSKGSHHHISGAHTFYFFFGWPFMSAVSFRFISRLEGVKGSDDRSVGYFHSSIIFICFRSRPLLDVILLCYTPPCLAIPFTCISFVLSYILLHTPVFFFVFSVWNSATRSVRDKMEQQHLWESPKDNGKKRKGMD